mmetsp:Transcript_24071/g.33637  ORF Transcript_24071/g.33637 Transcript_24071/m.33637 type:complete len:214 (+) Transcript_24071:108-749(+)
MPKSIVTECWFIFFTVLCGSLLATLPTGAYSSRFVRRLPTNKYQKMQCFGKTYKRKDSFRYELERQQRKGQMPATFSSHSIPVLLVQAKNNSTQMIQGNSNDGDSNSDKDTSTSDSQMADTVDSSLLNSLRARQEELAVGIGKRYITRTQKGFLNIHSDPQSGPYAVDNIVGQLTESQIVTSIGKFEEWIQHDAGGWSIAEFGGFVWLQPIDE